MVDRKLNINGQIVVVKCANELQEQADWFLGILAEMHKSGRSIEEGKRLQIGGSFVSLRRQPSGDLVVCEPDIERNPFQDETTDMSCTLRVLASQIALANRLAVEPLVTTFQDKVVMDQDCLQSEYLYMHRSAPNAKENDSGWFIGRQGPRASSPKLEAIYAFQVLQQRPELFPALILPVGYMVMANGQGIQNVINPDNEEIIGVDG